MIIRNDYPKRYYASYDKTASQPTTVTGWYDTWDMSSVDNVPKASDMIVVAESDWYNQDFRLPIGKGVKDGKIIDYTAPPPVIPLKEQAASLLKTQQAYVMQNYTIYGEDTPSDWLTYLKSLRAISDGTYTTSTSLPSAPTS